MKVNHTGMIGFIAGIVLASIFSPLITLMGLSVYVMAHVTYDLYKKKGGGRL